MVSRRQRGPGGRQRRSLSTTLFILAMSLLSLLLARGWHSYYSLYEQLNIIGPPNLVLLDMPINTNAGATAAAISNGVVTSKINPTERRVRTGAYRWL